MTTSDSTVTVTLRAKDEVSPVLRRIAAEVWVIGHPRLALAMGMAGWGIAGFLVGALLNALGWHIGL